MLTTLLAAALSLPADDSFSIADVKAASTLPPAKHHNANAPAPSAGKGKGKAEPMMVNYIMELATVRPAPEGGLGSTHVILAFIEPLTETIPGPDDDEWLSMSVLEWRDASEDERDELRRTLGRDGKPVKIMASIGGSRARHDKSTWPEWDPVEMGNRAAQYVLDLGLDGIDVDLEGWSKWAAGREISKQKWIIDERGPSFMKKLTLAIREKFDAASPNERLIISHAPQIPDFHKDKTYQSLLSDRKFWAATDFVNLQFYNQFSFPTNEHIYNLDIYPPNVDGVVDTPTCFESIINMTVRQTKRAGGWLTYEDVAAKLLLGFPCIGGSMMIDGYNHQECDAAKAAAVVTTGVKMGYPIAGVFEWSARPPSVMPEMLTTWNNEIRAAIQGNPIEHKMKLRADGSEQAQAGAADEGGDGCQAIGATVTADWCVTTCTPNYCPEALCSAECKPEDSAGRALLRQQAAAK